MSVDDPRIREQLDACRAGGDDLREDELRELATELPNDSALRGALARSQRWDTVIQRAVRRVSVPQDLAARLLNAVGDGAAAAASRGDDIFAPALAVTPPSPSATSPQRVRRRAWLVAASASAAVVAAMTLTLMYVQSHNGAEVTQQSLDREVRQWAASVDSRRWRSTEDSPPRTYPVSAFLPLTAHHWQALPSTVAPEPVVCYDLTPRGQQAVLLFVLRTARRVNLPTRPARPTLDTQMLAVGVWRDQDQQGLVYALAVEGNARRFQDLVRPRIASILPATRSRQPVRS